MRVVITGATGNIGTSVLHSLAHEPLVSEIVGLARRRPNLAVPKTEFVRADVAQDDLVPAFRGADAVIHLAWLVQPVRSAEQLEAVNVGGSRRVFDAVVRANVPRLLVASSIGAYAAGAKDRAVHENWPTTGISSSLYSRQKASVERLMDDLEWEHPEIKLVRMRPALAFKRAASAEIKRLFIGNLWPRFVFQSSFIPFVPQHPQLRFQAVHSLDIGDAFRLALIKEAKGPFNLAAEPPLDATNIACALGKPVVPVPRRMLSSLVALSYRLRLQPLDPGWLDLALDGPLISSERARQVLGWSATRSSIDAFLELLTGLREGWAGATPPLAPAGARQTRLSHQ